MHVKGHSGIFLRFFTIFPHFYYAYTDLYYRCSGCALSDSAVLRRFRNFARSAPATLYARFLASHMVSYGIYSFFRHCIAVPDRSAHHTNVALRSEAMYLFPRFPRCTYIMCSVTLDIYTCTDTFFSLFLSSLYRFMLVTVIQGHTFLDSTMIPSFSFPLFRYISFCFGISSPFSYHVSAHT